VVVVAVDGNSHRMLYHSSCVSFVFILICCITFVLFTGQTPQQQPPIANDAVQAQLLRQEAMISYVVV
jgi:hypothetical protein